MTAISGAEAVVARLADGYILPVVRTADRRLAEAALAWLIDAGMQAFEIAATIPGALGLIGDLAQSGHLVGAGTVFSRDVAEMCVQAGARLLISPGSSPAVAAFGRECGIPFMLGGLTPSEIVTAIDEGACAVKVFPVSSVGGVRHIAALRTVFPDIPLMPSGGVTIDDIPGYRVAGADFVGIGGSLVAAAAHREGDPQALRAHLKSMQALA